MSRRFFGALLSLLALSIARLAAAHGLGTSDLRLEVAGASVVGQWEIQPRDARIALGLDPRDDDTIDDLGGREAMLGAYLLRHLSVEGDEQACSVAFAGPMTIERDHLVFHVASRCPREFSRLAIGCNLLFDLDSKHRAYFSVNDARVTHVGVFRADKRSVTLEINQFHAGAAFLEFLRDGVAHIWTGWDHILFLLALLLPAPLLRAGTDWSPRAGIGPATKEIVKVVTAFTVAHSLTLCLGFFGVLNVPSRWVEVGIALSVFAAAWNNLRPFLPGRAWAMALVFGLVHGLGFAGALGNLSLPLHARTLALLSFNLGVEVGQLAIVALALPVLYAASRRRAYPRFVMGAGSLAIAWLAVIWILQRGFGLSLFA
jgi:hypothetical protein